MHSTILRTASFTWTPGTASKQVNFDASASACTNAPCTYSWNFGDGTAGAGVTTSHTYAAAGTYLAVVKVTDNTSAVTMSPIHGVTAVSTNTRPTAAATMTQTGWAVAITNTSTDDAGVGALAVTINCGALQNGSATPYRVTGTGAGPFTCNYDYLKQRPGSYVIRMTVRDAEGLASSINIPVTVPVKYSVSGSVMRVNGTTPVAGASVRLKKGAQVVKMALTNALGAYTLTGIAPDSYTVEAVKSGLIFSSTPAAVVINANITEPDILATR
jgi:hypothetical protein